MEPREKVEKALEVTGWALQTRDKPSLSSAYGVARRHTTAAGSSGSPDYSLYVGGQLIAVVRLLQTQTPPNIEKKSATEQKGEEPFSAAGQEEAASGKPSLWGAPEERRERRQKGRAKFVYETDGQELWFRDDRNDNRQGYKIAHFHRPVALAAYASGTPVPVTDETTAPLIGANMPEGGRTLLQRLEDAPVTPGRGLWPGELLLFAAVEAALRRGDRRVLAQMAHGAGKTHTLLVLAQHLLQTAGLHRVLLLVDNDPLAYQVTEEFRALKPVMVPSLTGTPLPPDVFSEKGSPSSKHLTDEVLGENSGLFIASFQRLINLMGAVSQPLAVDRTLHAGLSDEFALSEGAPGFGKRPIPYFRSIPPESFDVVLVEDPAPAALEWTEPIVEYFDAPVVAVSAAPARELVSFFGEPVATYVQEQAIADGSIVPYDGYGMRLHGTGDELNVQAGLLEISMRHHLVPRSERWGIDSDSFQLEEITERSHAPEKEASADTLILETFRDRLALDMYPTRALVPKTVIIARDEEHADQIVTLVSSIFGRGRHFCKNLSRSAADADVREPLDIGDENAFYANDPEYPHLTNFRLSEYPRIGVVAADSFVITCDLRPAEIVLVMAVVSSRCHFEMIKSRATRIMRRLDFLKVTRDGNQVAGKTHALLIDAVGLLDIPQPSETFPLDRRPLMSTAELLQEVAFATTGPDLLYTLAARLLRLDCMITPTEREQIARAAGGATLHTLAGRLMSALDPDRQLAFAERTLRHGGKPTEKALQQAATTLLQQSTARLSSSAELRKLIVQLDRYHNPTRFLPIVPEDDSQEVEEPGVSA